MKRIAKAARWSMECGLSSAAAMAMSAPDQHVACRARSGVRPPKNRRHVPERAGTDLLPDRAEEVRNGKDSVGAEEPVDLQATGYERREIDEAQGFGE